MWASKPSVVMSIRSTGSADACLLGGEDLVPDMIEMLHGTASDGFGYVVGLRTRGLPGARDDSRLTEHGAELVEDGGLDPARGHAADRARPGAMLEDGLADVVAVELAAVPGVRRREGVAVRPYSMPFRSTGVLARVRTARLRGLSYRMAWTLSQVSRSMMASGRSGSFRPCVRLRRCRRGCSAPGR